MANEIRTEELVKLNELPTAEMAARLIKFADQTDRSGTPSIWRAVAARLTAQAASLGECVEAMAEIEARNAYLEKMRAALTRARAVQAGGDPYAKVVEVAKRILAKLQHPTAHVTIIDSEDLEAALAEVTNG